MKPFVRAAEPAFLATNWEAWGIEWEQRRNADKRAQFNWHQVDYKPVNHLLLVPLKEQTQSHCSFCDNFPVSPPSIETIEHFRPKAQFPRDAYKWTNLYFCCTCCQQKYDNFDAAALQPDVPGYDFERYFRWDHTRGTIEVNERATPEDRQRAAATIKLYQLNRGHPSLRMRELRRRSKMPDEPLDEFAYRDYVSGPPPAVIQQPTD